MNPEVVEMIIVFQLTQMLMQFITLLLLASIITRR